MFNLGPAEMIMLCGVGVLLFGHKLPDVARSLGRSVVSFKQGLLGIETDIETSVSRQALPTSAPAEEIRPPRKIESPTI